MRPRVAALPKEAEPFYQSTAWKLAKAQKRAEGPAFCVVCGGTNRLILDHIVERKDGGEDFASSNLQWLCHAHHQAKTAKARSKRASGRTHPGPKG